jgi:hypothetical protein
MLYIGCAYFMEVLVHCYLFEDVALRNLSRNVGVTNGSGLFILMRVSNHFDGSFLSLFFAVSITLLFILACDIILLKMLNLIDRTYYLGSDLIDTDSRLALACMYHLPRRLNPTRGSRY